MRKLRGTLVTLLLVAAPGLGGCGDEKKQEGIAATRDGTATATPAPDSRIPTGLSGTWTASVNGTELADPPPGDLRKKDLVFKIRFLETGGVDKGPVMFLRNDDLGLNHANDMTEVSGDRIAFGDCRLEYAVEAEQLTWTTTKDACPGEEGGFRTVLTNGPWQRATG